MTFCFTGLARSFGVLLALGACSVRLPDHLSECPDDLCRQSWVSRAAASDPQVCDILPTNLGGDRCESARARPHLWQVKATTREAASHGQSLPTLTPPDAALLDPSALPSAAPCLTQADRSARAECLFQAAESSAAAAPPDGLGEATALCLSASPFVSQCLLHLLFQIGDRAPVAPSIDGQAWGALTRAIGSSVSAVPDPDFRERWRAQLWGNALRYAYDDADVVSGHPLDHLPAEALPHVRAAAVWRLWTLEQGLQRNLARWQARIDEVLASRPPPVGQAPARQLSRVFRDLWPENLAGEAELPRTALFVGAVRTTSPDPSTDALIALLEAAARSTPPGRELLSAALSHQDALVRWTAARLLGAHDPGRRLRQVAFEDPDPIVAARARYRYGQAP